MKNLYRLFGLSALAMLLFACDPKEPIAREGGKTNEEVVDGNEPKTAQAFELNSSLATFEVQALDSSTDKASEDELRASLHFNGWANVATTTLDPTSFGTGKREARWGVSYENGYKNYALNCEASVTTEAEFKKAKKNTVFFKSANENTIEGAKLKMYCLPTKKLKNIKKGFMCLDGKAGTTDADLTKQYFKGDTDPNHRIQALDQNTADDQTKAFDKGRHIPIMTKLEDFKKMSKLEDGEEPVKFSPRGSLIGLFIKNDLEEDIFVDAIVVKRKNALDFTGYFDWKVVDSKDRPIFVPEYTAQHLSQTALVFPVYKNHTATETGYFIRTGNYGQGICLYLWGFQNPQRKGEPLELQIRYHTEYSPSTIYTTPTFRIKPKDSKEEAGMKMFDDGHAYKTILTISGRNYGGGSEGTVWKDKKAVVNDGRVVSFDGNSVSLGFKTPLDFVAEAPAVNKLADAFVLNHDQPSTTTVASLQDAEVGYYTFDEANALFDGTKDFLKGYYLPNRRQLKSILPVSYAVTFQKKSSISEVKDLCQVGETPIREYTGSFKTVQEGTAYITYALRFKGTEWESAWRYSDELVNGKHRFVIKCVPLQGKAGATLDNISNPQFFIDNACTIRTFPAYGRALHNSVSQFLADLGLCV